MDGGKQIRLVKEEGRNLQLDVFDRIHCRRRPLFFSSFLSFSLSSNRFLVLTHSNLSTEDGTRRSGRARVISSKVAVVSEAELASAAAARLDALEADDDAAAAALGAGGGEGGGSDAEDFVPDDDEWDVSSEDFSDEDDEQGGGGGGGEGGGGGARGGEAGTSAAAAAAAAAARPSAASKQQQKKKGGKQSKKRPHTPKFGARTGAAAIGFSPKKKTRAAAAAEAAAGAGGGGGGGARSGGGGSRLGAKPFAQLLEEADLPALPSAAAAARAGMTGNAAGQPQQQQQQPHWLSAAMPAPRAAARRHWCSICGFRAPYSCPRCRARFCSKRCGGVHSETRCLKMVG